MEARAVVLALLAVGCGPPHGIDRTDGFIAPECFPERVSACHILVNYNNIVVDWTCTTGIGHPDENKPDHRPCVVCAPIQPMWCEAGTGSCVKDCATCTPSIVKSIDQWANCVPRDETWPPSWAPADMADAPIGSP